MAFVCRSSMASALLLLSLAVLSPNPTANAQNIGICYGMDRDFLPSAQEVVRLYKSNRVPSMRLYSPQENVLKALQGSGIRLLLDVPNENLKPLGSNASTAILWVENYVVPYASVVKYIAVGNEVMPDDSNAQFVLPAMVNVQNALRAAGLAYRIKVSTAVTSSVLSNTFPPSNSIFGDTAGNYTTPIIEFLKSNGSPLLVHIYPYFSYIEKAGSISLEYALFTSPGAVATDSGTGLTYQNLFDALVDSFYAALNSSGGNGVNIVVSETGWPSNGSDVATPNNAAIYYRNLIGHVANGTPMNQGQPLETYLYALFDENLKQGDEVERHFGLFTPQKESKYGISYSGVPTFLGSLCYD